MWHIYTSLNVIEVNEDILVPIRAVLLVIEPNGVHEFVNDCCLVNATGFS